MHIRTVIRDRAAGLLAGAGIAHVYKARLYPLSEAELPAVLVWCGDEEVERFDLGSNYLSDPGGGNYQRRMQLFIEIRAQAPTDLDGTLNALAALVEAALAADLTLGGACLSNDLLAVNFQQSGDGRSPTGALRLQYLATYIADPAHPEI